MNICIAGWYFKKESLDALASPSSFIVAHRNGDSRRIQMSIIPNKGLEFNCYDYYIHNIWKEGPTFFTHDDNFYTIEQLKLVSEISVNQAFIFSDKEEAINNGYAHGRAFYCSHEMCSLLHKDGFWWDEGNVSDVSPTTNRIDHHNNGIYMFKEYLKNCGLNETGVCAIVPGVKLGYRGEVKNGKV
jgi:hypothetical protein